MSSVFFFVVVNKEKLIKYSRISIFIVAVNDRKKLIVDFGDSLHPFFSILCAILQIVSTVTSLCSEVRMLAMHCMYDTDGLPREARPCESAGS
jgi:hypothetical protein